MSEIYSASDNGVKNGSKKIKPRKDYDSLKTAKVSVNPLTAFMVWPRDVKFETQDTQEKILLLLRQHPITNLPWIIIAALLLVAPLLLTVIPLIGFLPINFQTMAVIIWYLIVGGYVFQQFLLWYFNVYIITDERVVDYDFYSLLFKHVSEAEIERIEDVTFVMGGVARNIFHYGTVYIQTAGEKREIEFDDVPNPEQVVKLLNELSLEEQQEKLEGKVK
jgi:hypothetical protein